MGKKTEEPRRVVDEQWLTEQEERIQTLLALKPVDRLDYYGHLQTVIRASSSQLEDIFKTLAVSDIALSIDEKLYKKVFEELRSLAIATMNVNSEMTRRIPTKTVEQAKAEAVQKGQIERLIS